jgi:hypothetical protein
MDRPARFRPSVWHVALTFPIFAVGFVRFLPIRDNSFLWHITAGRLQLEKGSVLTADPFSFTKLGEPWRTQSWLADLAYATLDGEWALAYSPYLVWLIGSLYVVGIMLLVFRTTRSLVATSVMGVLTTVLSLAFLNPRPVIFSYLLFVLLVLAEQDDRTRWTLPLIVWVWAGIHGSFVIGGAYLVLQAVRRGHREAWGVVLASAVAALLTAHGVGVVETLLAFGQSGEALALINEWATPDLISIPMAPLFVGLLLLVWAGVDGRLKARDFLILMPFLALALSANRSVVPAWIALAPLTALGLCRLAFRERSVTLMGGIVNRVLMGGLVIIPLVIPAATELDEELFPIEAATRLTASRVFHDDSTGGYLIYAAWPQRLVYVDDRAELYGDLFNEFIDTRAGRPQWQETLDRRNIEEILLPVDQPLVETVRLAGWNETYADDNFVVMQRP